MSNEQNKATTAAVAALAAASSTPFKTAFKITMGIALAQLATLALIVASGAALLLGAAAIYTLVK